MPRTVIASVLSLVLAGMAGCRATAPAAPSATRPPTALPVASTIRALPSDFPVMPGSMTAEPPSSDAGLIASWTTAANGPRIYDFYVSALPAVGYPIEGLYPGGSVAIIRCRAPDGGIWQVVITAGATDGATHIELRLDRP
jgi:hypothetical protein